MIELPNNKQGKTKREDVLGEVYRPTIITLPHSNRTVEIKEICFGDYDLILELFEKPVLDLMQREPSEDGVRIPLASLLHQGLASLRLNKDLFIRFIRTVTDFSDEELRKLPAADGMRLAKACLEKSFSGPEVADFFDQVMAMMGFPTSVTSSVRTGSSPNSLQEAGPAAKS